MTRVVIFVNAEQSLILGLFGGDDVRGALVTAEQAAVTFGASRSEPHVQAWPVSFTGEQLDLLIGKAETVRVLAHMGRVGPLSTAVVETLHASLEAARRMG